MRVYKVSKDFGKKIQRVRRQIGISQEELAERVGVHRNHIGRIERGETNPPLPLIQKMAKVLKVSGKDLLPF